MIRAIHLFGFLTLGFIVSVQSGCESPDSATDETAAHDDDHGDHSHEGHGHADNFAGAIGELEEIAGTIGDSMAKGDPDAAHNPLHEVFHVLEGLPEFAKKEGLSQEQLTSVNGAVATLMDAYGEIDATMHGEEGKSWDDLKSGIDGALETLTAFEHTHDHGDHDHGDHDHGEGDDHDHGDHDHAEGGDHDHAEGGDHDHGDHDHGAEGDDDTKKE